MLIQDKIKLLIPDVFDGSIADWENVLYSFPKDYNIGECLESMIQYCSDHRLELIIKLEKDKS